MKKQLIIIGGGPSIKEGVAKGLWGKLEDKFTIGINFAFNFISPTLLTFCDKDFYKYGYKRWSKEAQKAHRMGLERLSFIIGKRHQQLGIFSNTVLLPTSKTYNIDISKGVYRGNLCGLFTLSLAIYFLEPNDEIYLLGFNFGQARTDHYEENFKSRNDMIGSSKVDINGKLITHFYQEREDLNHSGVGKTSWYNQYNKAEKMFGPFSEQDKVKIYNVCPTSRIPHQVIPKIDYDEFFKRLKKQRLSQKELRQIVNKKLIEAGYKGVNLEKN